MFISDKTKQFILEHINDDVFTLGFHATHYPDIDVPTAIVQIEGRQKTKTKLPSWFANADLIYPPHLALEQCSSEMTANYKATLVEGDTMVDLTGGLGVDSAALARKFKTATYVEHQEELCELAIHNFYALGLNNITAIHADAVTYLNKMNPVDLIYIDPARRNKQGGKVYAVSDCEPDLLTINETLLSKAQRVLVKLSPMLDVYAAMQQLKNVAEVHILSIANECKELLLLLDNTPHTNPTIHCINLNKSNTNNQAFSFKREEETTANCQYASFMGNYLYEPNASILKAGAFKIIATRLGIEKLHPNSHLYTSDALITNFPGKSFRVIGCSSFSKRDLHVHLSDLKKANISVRNFPMTALELHKRLKLSDGGNDFLFATTLYNDQHVIIRCERI